jgi:hypothetical protein
VLSVLLVGGLALWKYRGGPKGDSAAAGGGGGAAGGPQAAAAGPLSPLVPADAFALASLRVADVWNAPPVRQTVTQLPPGIVDLDAELGKVEQKTGLRPDDVERATLVVFNPKDETAWVVVTTRGPVNREKVTAALAAGAKEASHQSKPYLVNAEGERLALHFADDRTFVFAPEASLKRCLEVAARPAPSGLLADAASRAASGQEHLVAAIAPPPEDVQKALADAPPDVKPYLPVLEVRSAVLTANLGNALDLQLTATYADEAKAAAAKAAADQGLQKARDELAKAKDQMRGPGGPPGRGRGRAPQAPPQVQQMFTQAEAALKSLSPEQSGATLRVKFKADATGGAGGAMMAAGMLGPVMERLRAAGGNAESLNNLKQIALALHNYHDTHGHFPPAVIRSKAGKPLYSWRVELLPFLEERELYEEFHRDEPWDSPHNKALAARMPKVFALPGAPAAGDKTYYQVFTGPGTAFADPQGARIARDFKDGTSNTLLVVEAAQPVTWTEPRDLTYDTRQDPRRLVGRRGDKFQAVMADGRALLVPKSVSEASLRAAILPADGKTPGPDWP